MEFPKNHVWICACIINFLSISLVMAASSTPQDAGRTTETLNRICIITEPSPITYCSGQSGRYRSLMQHFTDHHRAVQLELITCEEVHPNPPPDCFEGRIPIHYTRGFTYSLYKNITASIDPTFKIVRVLRKKKIDLLHCTSPALLSFPTIVASRLYQIPLVLSYHTHIPVSIKAYFPSPFDSIIEYILWRLLKCAHWFADVTLVTSEQMKQEFDAHNIPAVVWQKGIDTKKFHPNFKSLEMRTRMTNGNPSEFLLVSIGRLAKEKRLKELRDVLEKMNGLFPTRLCFVGSGPEESELKEYFNGTPTVFMGRLDGEALSQTFASGDVFLLPSDSETLGFVILESMASGIPCVAAAKGGPIDLIDDGITGYLVPTGDVDAFVDRIEKLKNEPSLYKEMSQKCRKETEQWSWENSMDKLIKQVYPLACENFSRHRLSRRFLRLFGREKQKWTNL